MAGNLGDEELQQSYPIEADGTSAGTGDTPVGVGGDHREQGELDANDPPATRSAYDREGGRAEREGPIEPSTPDSISRPEVRPRAWDLKCLQKNVPSKGLRSSDREHACLPRAARRLDVDRVPHLRTEQSAAERRVGRDAADGRDLDLHHLASLVGELDDRPDADAVVRRVLDGDGAVQAFFQDVDAPLEEPLLVLRRVVLEVLGDVAELAGALDRFDDLPPPRTFELGELGLESGPLVRVGARLSARSRG